MNTEKDPTWLRQPGYNKNIQPPSFLLMGPPGTGKTYAIPTMMLAGIDVFVIGTEPNFVDTLLDSVRAQNAPIERLHYHSLVAMAPSWKAQLDIAHKVNNMSYADLADLKSGVGKTEMKGWTDLLNTCINFKDDRTGKEYGDVTEWGPDRCLVIDSLSGMNQMAREYVSGYKPNLHPGEWGIAMELERNLIYMLCANRHGYFVLISHIDRSIDELTQTQRITVSALGNKLGPKIPQFFSEVILAKREGDKFLWSTKELNVDVKNRALPIRNDLPPSFVSSVEVFKRRLHQLEIAAREDAEAAAAAVTGGAPS
jgi:hypothetical protein